MLHIWKHVCLACTSERSCWVISSSVLECQVKRCIQSAHELVGASLAHCLLQAMLVSSFNSFSKWFHPVMHFEEQVKVTRGLKKKKKESRKQCSRNVLRVIVKIGCYWFSHVHKFEILPWVRLAYSCLKFPATNGM